MRGVKKHYRFYSSSSHSFLTLPRRFTRELGWQNGDVLHILIRFHGNNPKILLHKGNEGSETKYTYIKDNSKSFVTIPIPVAKALNWKDKDTICIEPTKTDAHQGLLLRKVID